MACFGSFLTLGCRKNLTVHLLEKLKLQTDEAELRAFWLPSQMGCFSRFGLQLLVTLLVFLSSIVWKLDSALSQIEET